MRCLFCGKRLALLRKLTDGEFCSTAHRKRYLEEEQKLALARLIEEQHRSGQRRVAEAAPEPGKPARSQELAEFRAPQMPAKAGSISPALAPQLLEQTIDALMVERQGQSLGLARALWSLGGQSVEIKGTPRDAAALRVGSEVSACSFPPAGLQRCYGYQPSPVLTARDGCLANLHPCAPKDSARVSPRKAKASILLKLLPPIRPRPTGPASQVSSATAPLISAGLVSARSGSEKLRTPDPVCAAPAAALAGPKTSGLHTTGIALEHVALAERPGFPEKLASEVRWHNVGLTAGKENGRAAIPATPATLGSWAVPVPRSSLPERSPAQAPDMPGGPVLRGGAVNRPSTPPAIIFVPDSPAPAKPVRDGGLSGFSWTQTAFSHLPEAGVRTLPPVTAVAEWESFTAVVEDPPLPSVSEAAVKQDARPDAPAPALAVPQRRAMVEAPVDPALPAPSPVFPPRIACLNAAVQPCQPLARAAWRPEVWPGPAMISSAVWSQPIPAASGEVCRRASTSLREPAPSAHKDLVALHSACNPRRATFRPQETTAPATLTPKLVLPKLFLETVTPKGLGHKVRTPADPIAGIRQAKPWTAAPRFWKRAPADLKWISLALPAILLVTVISSVGWLPSKRSKAARGPEPPRSSYLENVVLERWASVRRNIGSRAAINLQDDFRSGLADWEGEGKWANEWQYDPAGFVLTGPLALYRPSTELTDYHFEFLGQIDKKSLNWVFRAADYRNYYAMKIVLLKSAPLPSAAIVRYAVINGKPDRAVQLPLPMPVRSDMFYRVRMDVRDQNFTTTVQGQVVDFWSDDRLSQGGVGFFSEKGERARLRWMEVSHQYDALGRLCALLAPYSIQSGNGSLNRP